MAVKDVATKVAEEWKGLTSPEKEVSVFGPFLRKEKLTRKCRNTRSCRLLTVNVTNESTRRPMGRSSKHKHP